MSDDDFAIGLSDGYQNGFDKGWNDAIKTSIHQAKHICPDAKELHDALEACLIKDELDDA